MFGVLADDQRLVVKVTHHSPGPDRYCWEIREHGRPVPVELGRHAFPTWEQAYQAGMSALKKFKQRELL